jgi:hypothetical protein
VRLSERGVTVESERWLSPSEQLALAFPLPDGAEPATIVAIAVAREASVTTGVGWRTELAFEQLSRGDAERIASFVVRSQFDAGR